MIGGEAGRDSTGIQNDELSRGRHKLFRFRQLGDVQDVEAATVIAAGAVFDAENVGDATGGHALALGLNPKRFARHDFFLELVAG